MKEWTIKYYHTCIEPDLVNCGVIKIKANDVTIDCNTGEIMADNVIIQLEEDICGLTEKNYIEK